MQSLTRVWSFVRAPVKHKSRVFNYCTLIYFRMLSLRNQAKINEKLQEAGLPAVQITEAPHIYDTPPNGFGVAASRHAPASVWPHHDRFYWKEHQAKRHPTRLEKLGINVNSLGGSRAVPLPIFDETQWDHVHHLPRDNEFESAGRRNYRDVGLHIMKKAGVNVDAMPVENSDDDGWLPKDGVPNKEFVHTLFGLNTKTPYFSGMRCQPCCVRCQPCCVGSRL